jgi:GT2 family glycosyltransferase
MSVMNTDLRQAKARPAGGVGLPECAVVLVCWNNKSYLEPCLRSLYESGMRHAFEVVVVDNGSTDGSQEMLAREFPRVLLVQNDRNVGLGRASNQGIEATRAPYVLLLNNDTLVDGNSLDRLIDWMAATPDAAAAGGTLLNGDGSFQAADSRFPTIAQEFLIATRLGELAWTGYPSARPGDTVRKVDWLSSACLLLRRAALGEVGLLDEQYFIYGDETDLQYRLIARGWNVYHLPEVTTIHFGGRSMDRWRRRRMVYRGKLLFFKKHYSRLRLHALRAMLGGLTVAKVGVWALAWPLPGLTERARRELKSNADVLRLCVKLD